MIKTPWAVYHFGGVQIGAKRDGEAVCSMWGTTAEGEENAAFIVHAVNAHDDLVAALRDLVIESGGSAIPNSSLTTARDRAAVVLSSLSSSLKQGE